MLLDDLFDEAKRQLGVCNSCRYCAGYCPVWPALELRTDLTNADMTHLANLCHDCRDCFTACMYTAPHEFALNPPEVFTAIREVTYTKYVWPQRVPSFLRGLSGLAFGWVVCVIVLVLLAIVGQGGHALVATTGGSPYDVISHWLLVGAAITPMVWSVAIMTRAVMLYWRDTHGPWKDLFNLKAWGATLSQASRLKHQSGGAEGCNYESELPTGLRRQFHQLVMYGFLLTFVSTTAAAVIENIFGDLPPYRYLSVPVITGAAGGVLGTIGCAGLMRMKFKANALLTTPTMRRADAALLAALLLLNLSGLAVLFTRDTAAFGIVLLVHLSAVIVSFGIWPYTKFVHWIYRLLAIQKDNVERLNTAVAAHG
jgi:citrate/tricarballylate utilization protein